MKSYYGAKAVAEDGVELTDDEKREAMLDGIKDLFSQLVFEEEIGEIDRMKALNYYELREMMYLSSEKAKYRSDLKLSSRANVPSKVADGMPGPPPLVRMKDRFRSQFVESVLAGFSTLSGIL